MIDLLSHGPIIDTYRTVRSGAPAILLDRDGVLNENRSEHVLSISDIRIIGGALDALQAASNLGFAVLIATNQASIADGAVSADAVLAMTRQIADEASGGAIAAAAICPHARDAGCACRKPRSGLLQALHSRFRFDLERSVFVGDAATDADAAEGADIQPVVVRTGRWKGKEQLAHGTVVCDDLKAAVEFAIDRCGLG